VEAELPGFQKENISLQFENNVLTIEGKQVIAYEALIAFSSTFSNGY
jgi:HSP20 family molecular chaperone IbpA